MPSCGNKIRHASRDEAEAHIKALVWRNASTGRNEFSAGLNAYTCDRCGAWHVGRLPAADLVWFYTMGVEIDDILRDEALKPVSARPEAGDIWRATHPLVWFTRSEEWESWRNLDITLPGEPNRRLTTDEVEVAGEGLYRFGVPASCAPLRWYDYLRLNSVPRYHAANIVRQWNTALWLASDQPVSFRFLRALDIFYRGKWCPIEEVTAEAFNRYLRARRAVSTLDLTDDDARSAVKGFIKPRER